MCACECMSGHPRAQAHTKRVHMSILFCNLLTFTSVFCNLLTFIYYFTRVLYLFICRLFTTLLGCFTYSYVGELIYTHLFISGLAYMSRYPGWTTSGGLKEFLAHGRSKNIQKVVEVSLWNKKKITKIKTILSRSL